MICDEQSEAAETGKKDDDDTKGRAEKARRDAEETQQQIARVQGRGKNGAPKV